jgi:hypothetical protein
MISVVTGYKVDAEDLIAYDIESDRVLREKESQAALEDNHPK